MSKLSLSRPIQRQLSVHSIIKDMEAIRNYLSIQEVRDVEVVDIYGIATLNEEICGIVMPKIEGIPSSISSDRSLSELAEDIKKVLGISLDTYGRNVILNGSKKILIDIL